MTKIKDKVRISKAKGKATNNMQKNSATEWHDIFKVMKGKTYNQEYSAQQGSCPDLLERLKALQTIPKAKGIH